MLCGRVQVSRPLGPVLLSSKIIAGAGGLVSSGCLCLLAYYWLAFRIDLGQRNCGFGGGRRLLFPGSACNAISAEAAGLLPRGIASAGVSGSARMVAVVSAESRSG